MRRAPGVQRRAPRCETPRPGTGTPPPPPLTGALRWSCGAAAAGDTARACPGSPPPPSRLHRPALGVGRGCRGGLRPGPPGGAEQSRATCASQPLYFPVYTTKTAAAESRDPLPALRSEEPGIDTEWDEVSAPEFPSSCPCALEEEDEEAAEKPLLEQDAKPQARAIQEAHTCSGDRGHERVFSEDPSSRAGERHPLPQLRSVVQPRHDLGGGFGCGEKRGAVRPGSATPTQPYSWGRAGDT